MVLLRDVFSFVTSNSNYYSISFYSKNNSQRLYSHNLHALYNDSLLHQIFEKIFHDNFKVICVTFHFKNNETENKKRNNKICLEINLENSKNDNSTIVKSMTSIMKLENSKIYYKLYSEFGSKVPLKLYCVESEMQKINQTNFRKPIKIKPLNSSCFFEDYEEYGHHKERSNSDIINEIYDEHPNFKLRYYLQLFGVYFIFEMLDFTFSDISEKFNSLNNDILENNEFIKNKFNNEKKDFQWFKNNKLIFVETKKAILGVENIQEIFKDISEFKKNNIDKEKIFNFCIMLKNVIFSIKPNSYAESKEYDDLKLEIESTTKSMVSLCYADNTAEFRVNNKTWNRLPHLKFNLKNCVIYINMSKMISYNDELFSELKNRNIFFNLMEILITNDFSNSVSKKFLENQLEIN